MKKLFYALFAAVLLASCGTSPAVKYNSPDFGLFDKNRKIYKAVNSHNVRIIIYNVETGSDEKQAPGLWMNEVKLVLKSKGYNAVRDESFTAASGKDVLMSEFETFYNGEPYIYSLAIISDKNNLIISEAGGRKTDYTSSRSELVKIIKSI